jgi:hypothetical protein
VSGDAPCRLVSSSAVKRTINGGSRGGLTKYDVEEAVMHILLSIKMDDRKVVSMKQAKNN